MKSRFTYFSLIILIFLFACRTTKKIVDNPSATLKLKGAEVIQVFDSVQAKEFLFSYLSAKAEVSYTDKSGETTSFDINLRICHDSLIWISITPLLGIELARVMINKDSVIVLDRLHKQYLKRDFLYFEDLWKTNVNYEMIQSVIVGNYFQYLGKEKIKSVYDEEPYMILSTLNKRQVKRAAEEKDPSKPVVQDFWIDGNYRIAKSKITDDKQNRYVEATYSNFMNVNGYLFAKSLVVTLASSTPTIINVEYSKVSNLDSLQLPFSIPDKYVAK
jgi:hypothetical protein